MVGGAYVVMVWISWTPGSVSHSKLYACTAAPPSVKGASKDTRTSPGKEWREEGPNPGSVRRGAHFVGGGVGGGSAMLETKPLDME